MTLILTVASVVILSDCTVNGLAASINPDNQAAAKIIEARISRLFNAQAARGQTLMRNYGCEACASVNLGAIVKSDNRYGILGTKVAAPAIACNAEAGFSYSCSLVGGGMQIDGTWAVGHVSIGRYSIPRLQGTPIAEGRFTLTVRNYNVQWSGRFRKGGSGSRSEYSTNFNADMACSNVPMRPDVDFAFSITRTSGSESSEFTSAIEELARKAVSQYYCDNANRQLRQPFYDALLRGGIRNRMIWGSIYDQSDILAQKI